MFTPPTTTAAMTWSVTPVAAVALIVPNSMPHRMPATPGQQAADGEDRESRRRESGCPRISAASGLLPTA